MPQIRNKPSSCIFVTNIFSVFSFNVKKKTIKKIVTLSWNSHAEVFEKINVNVKEVK